VSLFNIAPSIPVSGVVAGFADSDPAGTTSDYTATISWGDGTSSPGSVARLGFGFTVSGTHTYNEDGDYTISVGVADQGGATATVPSASRVADPQGLFALLVDLILDFLGF
jgi:hypothetical protein